MNTCKADMVVQIRALIECRGFGFNVFRLLEHLKIYLTLIKKLFFFLARTAKSSHENGETSSKSAPLKQSA